MVNSLVYISHQLLLPFPVWERKLHRLTVTVDEIKGTYRDLHKVKEASPVHLAQAKCYAYIYGSQNDLKRIRVRLTYCNIDTEEIKYFHFEYGMDWASSPMG